MSGTSADGIDSALVEIVPDGKGLKLHLLTFAIFPYPPGLQERILQVASQAGGTTEEICHLNAYLGELFAQAALGVAEKAGIPIEEIDLIGSHGQTIGHFPDPAFEGDLPVRSTLQIGEPSIIAERTGLTTIADFRPRDLAAGGEGAPLAPILHHVLFQDPFIGRIVLNIGGIANLTFLPPGAGPEAILAFDTGPGNVLLDGMAKRLKPEGKGYDEGGRLAAKGTIHGGLLGRLMEHPFIRKKPPKSTGRETFGLTFLEEIWKTAETLNLRNEDLIATLAAFTVEAIAWNMEAFILQGEQAKELIVSGGGTENPFLMTLLKERLPSLPVVKADEAGFPGRALEASAFALLAYLTFHGKPGNLPGATGGRLTVLGKIVPGRHFTISHFTSHISHLTS
ncbi:MAG: anhydro-N-acetylmuramic acid kinase [candidate division NC10 bacterium]|nr:anhydro-N-acetylmuramic acid kinase [candidate division NC10 bacterium]